VLQSGKNPTTGVELTSEEIAYYKAALQQLAGANAALNQVIEGMNPEQMSTSLDTLSAGASSVADGVATVESGLKQLQQEGTSQVAQGASTLNDSAPALEEGINTLESGASQVAQGASDLSAGIVKLSTAVTSELRPGVDTLYQGGLLLKTSVAKLYDGTQTAANGGKDLSTATNQVSDGINKLYDGSVTLDNGMLQFKEEAIDKLEDVAGSTLKEAGERIKAILDLADNYNIYTDAAEGKNTSVKFIYETDGISD
jgi:putative membrane protein